MTETHRVTYVGPARSVGALAQELSAQGLVVHYDPPRETKDLMSVAEHVAVVMSITGSVTDIAALARDFLLRNSGTKIVGLPVDEAQGSVKDRLTSVDQLLHDQVITPEEHRQQRQRILDEL